MSFRVSVLATIAAANLLSGALAQVARPSIDSLDVTTKQANVDSNLLPLAFESNEGQARSEYRFVTRNAGGGVLFTDDGADFILGHKGKTSRVHFHPLSPARPTTLHAEGQDALRGKANYLIGADSSRWLHDVPTFGKVEYRRLYPGVDLIFYGNRNHLEHDFVVAPHANPAEIRFSLDGADKVHRDSQGDLQVSVSQDNIIFQRPVAYQSIAGKRLRVDAAFVVRDRNVVSFKLGAYDPRYELVIDPVLTFATYLSGSHADVPATITNDSAGNIYVAGGTESPDYPIVNGFETTCPTCADDVFNDDAYISKLDPTGRTLLYSTYIGGSGEDEIDSLRIDSNGNMVAVGYTASADFPKAGSFVSSVTSGMFVLSLNAAGSQLNFSEVVGDGDFGSGGLLLHRFALALDSSNNAYVLGKLGGNAQVPQFPITAGTYGSGATNSLNSLTVTKLAPNGAEVWGTIIPPSGSFYNDYDPNIGGIALDAQGDVYIAGTSETYLPTTSGTLSPAFPNAYANAGGEAGFLLALNPTASGLLFSTYLPGTDSVGAVAFASDGSIYITGETSESNLPVSTNALQPKLSAGCSCNNGYLLHVNATGTQVLGATYLSGTIPYNNGGTGFGSIAFDSSGNVFVGGMTSSIDFPVVNPIASFFDGTNNPTDEGSVVAGLSPDLSKMIFGSYFNGYGAGSGLAAMTISSTGQLLLAGTTYSTSNFIITPNAYQTKPPKGSSLLYTQQWVGSVNLSTPAPSVCFNSVGVIFPRTVIGVTATASVQVTNCGNATLNIQSISSSTPLVTASQTCTSLSAGSSCTLQLSYTPVDATYMDGTVTLATNAVITTQNLAMTGLGAVGTIPFIRFPIPTHTYGDAPFSLAAASSSTGAFSYSIISGPATISGSVLTLTGAGSVTVQVSQAAAGSYESGTTQTSFVVNKEIPAITLVSSANPAQAQASIQFTATLTGGATGTVAFVEGATTLCSGTVNSGVATCAVNTLTATTHSVIASYSGDSNFAVASSTPLAQVVTDFALTSSANSSSQSVQPGAAATFNLNFSPTGTTFPSAITFGVSGLPAGSQATFTPSSIAAGSGATTVVLSVQTAAVAANHLPLQSPDVRWAFALLCLPAAAWRKRHILRNGRIVLVLFSICLSLLAVSLSGCSGGGTSANPPAPQSYSLVVTATSGSLSHATTVTLTVQ